MKRNRGVEERDRRDRDQLRAEAEAAAGALERKAQLYERLARGEAPDVEGLYNVDFIKKSATG